MLRVELEQEADMLLAAGMRRRLEQHPQSRPGLLQAAGCEMAHDDAADRYSLDSGAHGDAIGDRPDRHAPAWTQPRGWE